MARYNEILVGRFNRFMQKMLSMKGPASLATLSDEMMAVLPLFNGAENRYLDSWNLFAAQQQVAAQGAGLASQIRLRNPAGSNVIAVIEQTAVYNISSLKDQPFFFLFATTVDLATLGNVTGAGFDTRALPNPTCILSGGNSTLPGTSVMYQGAFPADGTFTPIVTENQEVPLLPGSAAAWVSNVANQQLAATFRWRERFLEDSERK